MPESWGTYCYMGLQMKPGKLLPTKWFLVQVRISWQQQENFTFTTISVHASLFSCPVDCHSNSHSTSVKKFKGPTPTVSSHSSQPGFDELGLMDLLNKSPKSQGTAKQHVSALIMLFICKLITLLPFHFLLRPWSGMDTVALSQEMVNVLWQNTIQSLGKRLWLLEHQLFQLSVFTYLIPLSTGIWVMRAAPRYIPPFLLLFDVTNLIGVLV